MRLLKDFDPIVKSKMVVSCAVSLVSCDMFASNSIFTLVSWLQNQLANNSRYVIQRGANLDDCLTNHIYICEKKTSCIYPHQGTYY